MDSLKIYKVLFVLTHFVYTIFEYIFDVLMNLKRYISHENQEAQLNEEYATRIRNLKKIPVHLTLLLGEENPSVKDLAKIILWSLTSGIKFVSIYDHKGEVQCQINEIKNEIKRIKHSNQHVVWESKGNGFSENYIHVKTLSIIDGRENIINATKELSQNHSSNTIDTEFIDNYLRKKFEFPDPCLGIYCGKYFTLNGYPPWQIRFTEFINVRTFYNISQESFFKCLQIYSKVNQNLGK